MVTDEFLQMTLLLRITTGAGWGDMKSLHRLSATHGPHRWLQSYKLGKRQIPSSQGGLVNGNTGKA